MKRRRKSILSSLLTTLVLALSLWTPYCLAMQAMPSAAAVQCSRDMGSPSGMNQHCAQLQATASYLGARAASVSMPDWQPLATVVPVSLAPACRMQARPGFFVDFSPPSLLPLNLRYCVFLK